MSRSRARGALDRSGNPVRGFTPCMLERMEAILLPSGTGGVRIVPNMGAANPLGAARALLDAAPGWGVLDPGPTALTHRSSYLRHPSAQA